ncbi:hypothetical protein GCM10025880_21440 [Methylorubrum aminovorans]|nr:hypothetical protein GCM10025880_21440 [Methylorubrum aminovorans]
MDREILVADAHRHRADPLGLAAEHGIGPGIILGGDHRRAAALDDAGLLHRHRLDGVAEIFGMVAPDRGDDGAGRVVDDVGGIDPAAEADFEQQHVGRAFREQQQGRRRGDLEHGDRIALVGRLAPGEGVGEPVLGDVVAAADAPNRMRSWKRTRWGEV